MVFFQKGKLKHNLNKSVNFVINIIRLDCSIDNQAHISIVLGAGIISRAILES